MTQWIQPSNVQAVLLEVGRAVEKHGFMKTPLQPHMSHARRLAVLTEEVGEVAERVNALTFNEEPEAEVLRDMYKELTQVAAVALMHMEQLWTTGVLDEEESV